MPNCSFKDSRTACINYESVNELDIQSIKISNTSLSRHDELQSQGQSNLRSFNSDSYSRVSTRNYKANHKGEMKFGRCLSCGKFHSRNSCAFRNAKCFKCGKIGHIQSVCKAIVHFASNSTKSCHLNLNNSDVSSDHLSFAIRKGWNANLKRRFPIYFSKRDELSTTRDGILCLNDRVVIPLSLRKSVLEDLHSSHSGVEKMKS
ncbi:unnamed protein product [Schistosoma margrebowiei]|uniref:Uncharacterized protein n=1 Tax=Schistosoma margrebowiei TaxID=48269 RepID=A0A183MWZ6_9TREM|nr:unnamed protein product [Schistosoma margrebowiei]